MYRLLGLHSAASVLITEIFRAEAESSIFCTIPEKKLTFDIQYEDNGLIRLWRFIGTAPASKAGKRCEYRASKYPSAVVGMEVTDEGDVSFYAEQKVDITDSRSAVHIDKMISRYINLQVDNFLALAL